MFFEPLIAILYNEKAKRWHPIIFEIAPFPGPDNSGPKRFRSKGHHTTGFADRELAITHVRDDLAKRIPHAKLRLENDIEWDGNDIPAMTILEPQNNP